MSTTFADFLRWEAHSRDTIDFKKIYVDIAGDLNAGLMLSELMYWYLPSKNSEQNKLRVTRDKHQWVAVHRYEWWERIRISPDQADRALGLLVKKQLVIKTRYKFANEVCVHVRINEPEFLKAWDYAVEHPAQNPFILNPKLDLGKKAKSKSVKKQNQDAEEGKILNTETTTPNTTEITTVGAPEISYHPFIEIWIGVRKIDKVNIGAPVASDKDTACAKRMAKWPVPPTQEEITTAIQLSKSKTYAFQWLEDDIPKIRLARGVNTPTPVAAAPPPAAREVPLTADEAAARVAEYERLMAEITDMIVEKAVA